MPQTYTNPKTGEQIQWDGKAWVPVPKAAAQPAAPSPMRPPSLSETAQGPSYPLGRIGEAAGAGVKKLEMGSLRSEAAGNKGRAFLKRTGADLLRPIESAGRISSGMMSPLNQAAAATAIAVPPTAPFIGGAFAAGGAYEAASGKQKGEDKPSEVERRLLGGATVAGGVAGFKGGRGFADAAAKAKFTDITSRLENFRITMKKVPIKDYIDVAHQELSHLKSAVDTFWEPVHARMAKAPVNPEVITSALKSIYNKFGKDFVDNLMPTSASGASQKAPLWDEGRALSKNLYELSKGKDKVLGLMAKNAKAKVDAHLEAAAETAGVGAEYRVAKSLTRKLENVEYHTARLMLKTGSAGWEIAGAGLGALAGESLGPAGALGGMYAGHHLGRALGKRFTSEPRFKISPESIAGAEALYHDMGIEPPSGFGKSRVKLGAKATQPIVKAGEKVNLSHVIKTAKAAAALEKHAAKANKAKATEAPPE